MEAKKKRSRWGRAAHTGGLLPPVLRLALLCGAPALVVKIAPTLHVSFPFGPKLFVADGIIDFFGVLHLLLADANLFIHHWLLLHANLFF